MEIDENIITIKKMILKKFRFIHSTFISNTALNDRSFDVFESPMLDGYIANIKMLMLGKQVSKNIIDTVRYPATWRDAFKDRWFPKFLKKRYPPKFKTRNVTVHIFHVCPHIEAPVGHGLEVHFQYVTQGELTE